MHDTIGGYNLLRLSIAHSGTSAGSATDLIISFISNSFRCLAVTDYRTSPVLFHTKGHQESFYPSINPSQQLQKITKKKAPSHPVCRPRERAEFK